MICQVCGAVNDPDREVCRRCQSRLLVVSGTGESYDEGPPGDGVSLDEHLLERVSVLEEIVKRSAETLKSLLEGFTRQEKNGFVVQTGLLALKDLLERRGLVAEEEFLELWEGRVDQHMAVLEKRERFLERKERLVGGFRGERRERFLSLLSEAELAFFALDPDAAIRHLEDAWRLDRANAELAFYLGETYFNEGEAAKASVALRAVLEREPDHFEALVYGGVLESDLGRPERAIESLKKALALKSDAFLPTFALGALYAGAGQLAKAEAFLKRAVGLEENAQALSLLGTISSERGRVKEAIEALQKAIRLDPGDEEALWQLGLCYLDRGWTQKAAERFRAALELNPNRIDFPAARALLGGAAQVRGRSAAWAEKAAAAAPRDPEKSLRLYRRALKADPENGPLLVSYALAGAAAGRTSEAVSLARRVLTRKPEEEIATAAYATLLEALRAEGKFREGSRVASEMLAAVRSRFGRAIAYAQRASARADMGEELDAALADAERAVRLAPREVRAAALAARGWVHYRRGEYERAVASLKRSAELGETATSLAHLGLALLASGDARGARQALLRARRRGGRTTERKSGLESRMLEQIRRNLRLAERAAAGRSSPRGTAG